MVTIRSITVAPPLINTSCAWASDEAQLTALFNCPYTGAVTTRTATLSGFDQDASRTVAFLSRSLSSINSYGYSPHPIASYVGSDGWIPSILRHNPHSTKPFLISITGSRPADLRRTLEPIRALLLQENWATRIGVELNTSCPNIPHRPPLAYDPAGTALAALLDVLAEFFWLDTRLTLGIKLPPYVTHAHMVEVVQTIAAYSRVDRASGTSVNPFAFLTCTNTLGNTVVFADEVEGGTGEFAVPTAVGGLGGEAIHALSLGNVYTFSTLLAESDDPAMRQIVVIGAGGVTSAEAVARMHRAGAHVVGCATFLGKWGVSAFRRLGEGALH